MEKRPIQEEGRGRVEVRLVAVYYRYRDKLPPDRPLGSCVVITFYIKIGKGKAENVFSLHPELLSLYIEDDAVAVDKTFKSHSATLHVVKTCCQNAWLWREGIREGLESNPGGSTIASQKPEFCVVCLLLISLSCFSDMDMCMDRCCAQRGCNVAYMVDKNCFSVACFSPSLCKISDVSSTNGDVEISTIMESTAERPAEKREYKMR